MSAPLYISRNYTEFGPFSPLEIADFIKRGILRSGDHLRPHGEDEWIEVDAWTLPAECAAVQAEKIAPSNPVAEDAASALDKIEAKPAAKKATKKAVSKKAPAKKAAKKAAKDA